VQTIEIEKKGKEGENPEKRRKKIKRWRTSMAFSGRLVRRGGGEERKKGGEKRGDKQSQQDLLCARNAKEGGGVPRKKKRGRYYKADQLSFSPILLNFPLGRKREKKREIAKEKKGGGKEQKRPLQRFLFDRSVVLRGREERRKKNQLEKRKRKGKRTKKGFGTIGAPDCPTIGKQKGKGTRGKKKEEKKREGKVNQVPLKFFSKRKGERIKERKKEGEKKSHRPVPDPFEQIWREKKKSPRGGGEKKGTGHKTCCTDSNH